MRKRFVRGAALLLAAGVTAWVAGVTRSFAADSNEEHSGFRTRNVAIVLYPGVEVLDFAGPGEVFASAARFGALRGVPAFRTYTVATTKKPLVSQGFLTVQPEFDIDDAPAPDILVIPGGSTGALTRDPRFMAWATGAIGKAELTLTVCTGAFVPGQAGLLDGRTVTTWYGAIGRLRDAVPEAEVQDGRRFVDSGSIVTTAGVSAGIDGALHVVARLLGRRVADSTARYMEYHWSPEPYLSTGYSQLTPDLSAADRAAQQARSLEDDQDWSGAAAAWRGQLARAPDDAYAWHRLGMVLQRLGRLDESAEAEVRASADATLRGEALYSLACARARQGRGADALDALERSAAAGFPATAYAVGDQDLASLRDDPRFRRLVASQ